MGKGVGAERFREEMIQLLEGAERGTQAKLERYLGKAPGYITEYKQGRMGVDEETRRKIAGFFGALYEDLAGYSPFSGAGAAIDALVLPEGAPKKLVSKALLERVVQADSVSQLQSVSSFMSEIIRALSPELGVEQVRTVLLDNDSMEPGLREGDHALVDLGQVGLVSGKIYLIIIDGQPLLKRAELRPGGWLLRSDNSQYFSIDYKDNSDVQILGRVVQTFRKI